MRIGSMLASLVVAQLTLFATAAAQQQPRTATLPKGAILFRVTETASAPVAETEIVLPALGVSVTTSARGEVFLTDVPAGTYIVQARSPGYRAEWLSFRVAGDTVGAIFTLGPLSATLLDTMHVREEYLARLVEFDHRRRTSPYGRFRTREEIERLGASICRRHADLSRRRADVGGLTYGAATADAGLDVERQAAEHATAEQSDGAEPATAVSWLRWLGFGLDEGDADAAGNRQPVGDGLRQPSRACDYCECRRIVRHRDGSARDRRRRGGLHWRQLSVAFRTP